MALELDNLTEWFKENVLEIHQSGDVAVADDDFDMSVEKPSKGYTEGDGPTVLDVESTQEADDELSLIEYIIGVDTIEF